MSDEEILKTEKILIDFLMQISNFFEWDCTSSDLQTFRNLPKKQFRFHQKKICLNFAERINHLSSGFIFICVKSVLRAKKDWKVGKLFIVKLPIHFTVMESNGYHFLDDNQLIWAKKLFSEFVDKNCSMNDLGYSDLNGGTFRK